MKLPGWVGALAAVACIAAGAWMFVADPFASEPRSARTDRSGAESVLSMPDEGDGTDARRRGDAGRDRIDDDEILEAGDESSTAAAPLPAVFESLSGRRIALAGTVYAAPGATRSGVRIGRLRLACADSVQHAATGENELLAATRSILDRAGATVTLVADGPDACVDDRVRTIERSADAVVIRVDGSGAERVLAGYAAASGSAADRARAGALAREVAAQLGLATPAALTRPIRDLLIESGAIDLPGGGAVVLVDIEPTDDQALQDAAFRIARALAVRASGATTG